MLLQVLISLFILAIALLHVWFLALEMFFWQKPLGQRVFRMSPEHAQTTAVLAANQGLYNGFLAAGLLLSLVPQDPKFAYMLRVFFLECVFIAGVYGAYSVSRRILWIQAAPAFVALMLVIFGQ